MPNLPTQKLTLAALLLAMGLLLPTVTGNIPQIGNALLPMHLPVLLTGLICGWKYGLIVGAVTPLLRSLIFGAPPLFPIATAMAFELATYGLVIGLVYLSLKNKNILSVYVALVAAMIVGRVVWGLAMMSLLGMNNMPFSMQAFMAGALINAVPGIVLQLVLIPVIIEVLTRASFFPLSPKGVR